MEFSRHVESPTLWKVFLNSVTAYCKPPISAFREYDTNNSGFINREELTAWFEKHGGEPENLIDLIEGADFNDDGKIDYEEFICMVVKKQI